MGWKNWSYWLRGGTILSSVFIILFFVLLIIDPVGKIGCSGGGHPCFPLWFFPAFLGIFVAGLFGGFSILGENYLLLSWGIFGFIFSFILYFLIGALLGWIVHFLKNNKHSLYYGLVFSGIILLLGIISLIFPTLSLYLFGSAGLSIDIIIPIFIAFIIGAIIGWIVGKIRNKTNFKTRVK